VLLEAVRAGDEERVALERGAGAALERSHWPLAPVDAGSPRGSSTPARRT
jgi:hypothetical protein